MMPLECLQPLKTPTDGQYEELSSRHVDVENQSDYVHKEIAMTSNRLEGQVPFSSFCEAP